MAHEAEIIVAGHAGERRVPTEELHRRPGNTPHIDNQLQPGELIVAIELPLPSANTRSGYLKVRDRTSFAFALASAAVAIDVQHDGTVRKARIAVAGVATTPYRLRQVERRLEGHRFDRALCREAGSIAAEGAVSHGENAYKIPLLRNTVTRALEQIGGLA